MFSVLVLRLVPSACIVDNVGDNVGDMAGVGADFFGWFTEATCATSVPVASSGAWEIFLGIVTLVSEM